MARFLIVVLTLFVVAGCSDQTSASSAKAEPLKVLADPYQTTLTRLQITPPPSPWAAGQKQLFATLLGKHHVDVLVVPVQVLGSGLDRVERRLIDLRVAQYLAASTGRSVADPVLVSRALGEGQRAVQPSEVYSLAQSTKAKLLVWPQAGHDEHGRMVLAVRRQTRDDVGGWLESGTKQWSVVFSEEELPAEVIGRLLPEIAALVDPSAKPPATSTVARADSVALPSSPLAMLAEETASPVVRANYLELLALLHPEEPELAQERAFVRALAALDELAPDSPDLHLLKARALFHLDRRPAALHALGTPQTSAERAMLAAINGNLPDLEREVAQVESPVHRLLAEIELADLRHHYGVLERAQFVRDVAPLTGNSPEWNLLLHRRYMEWDRWERESNITLKALLDRMFPVEGFTAESMTRGQAVLAHADSDPGRFELSVQEHLSRLLAEKPGEWCCQAARGPRAWDVLGLVEGQAEANLLWQVEFYVKVQANARAALSVSDRFDATYHGHGALAAQRAKVFIAVAETMQGAERANFLKQAISLAQHAMYWSDPRTSAYADSLHFINTYATLAPPGNVQQTAALVGALQRDVPRRWWQYLEQVESGSQEPEAGARALRYATEQFVVLESVVERESDPQVVERILHDNEQRFVGSPHRLKFLAQRAREKGDFAALEALYQEARSRNPNDWVAHRELGRLKIERGDYAEALKVFLGYPPLTKTEPEHSVAVANGAAEAASMLFWRGAVAEAVPLYKIAADLQTGAESSLVASVRLKVLDGRFAEAAGESLGYARRYHSAYGYSDYLAWLHVLGFSKEAWLAFDELAGSFETPQLWASALVGHRIEGHSDAQVRAWLKSERVRSAEAKGYRFAPYHAILANAVDRKPAVDFAAFVAELEGSQERFGYTRLWRYREDNVASPASAPVPLDGAAADAVPFKTELAYFAEAYALLRNDDSAGAYSVFADADSHYILEGSYAMPYFAWAAAKSGNAATLEARLPSHGGFDLELARAFLAGLKGDHTTALSHLQRAFATRPHTLLRPIFTEYQYAEACEWLFLETRHEPYRELALDWTRKHQRMQPMYAWAYAMEAKLTRSPADRMRAVAIAQYLDPGSERLASIPAKERERAKAWFGRNNPFKSKPSDTAAREALKPA